MEREITFKGVIIAIVIVLCTYALILGGIHQSKMDYGLHHSGIIESEFAHNGLPSLNPN